MRELASAEVFVIVNELQGLAGSRLNNFYDLGNGSFRLDFSSASVFIKLNSVVCLTMFKEEAGQASEFAIAIRKRIKGLKLSSIRQHKLDRIIVFSFSGERKYYLVVELFAKGNVVLLNEEHEVELAYAYRKFKERSIEPRAKYMFPAGSSIGNKEIREKAGEVVELACKEDTKLINAIGKYLNLGPMYVEDIILKSGLDPNARANGQEIAGKKEELVKNILAAEQLMRNPRPLAYVKDNKIVDFSIYPVNRYNGYEQLSFNTLSELLDALYAEQRSRQEEEEKLEKLKELEKSIEKQEELAKAYAEEAAAYRAFANKIFEHMAEINALLSSLRQKKEPEQSTVRVISIDWKNKEVEVEIE